MKILRINIQIIAFILSILLFFQNCTVYKSEPVTLLEAAEIRSKIKIETKNRVLKFKYIKKDSGNYYGVMKVNGSMKEFQLNANEIQSIMVKNNTFSTTTTVVTSIGAILGALAIIGFGQPMSGTVNLSQ